MHRSVWLLAAVFVATSVCLAAPALAGDNGARKVDFFSLPDAFGCNRVQPGVGTPTKSSAVMNRNPAGTEVTVLVQLQDALPNTTYVVIIQTNDCETGVVYRLTTNKQGNETQQLLGVAAPRETINNVNVSARALGETFDLMQIPRVTFG